MLLQKRTDNNPLWNLIEAVEQELGTSAAPPALPPSSNPYAPIADPVINADRLAIQTQFMGNSAINNYNESYKLAHPYAAVPSTFGPLLVPPSLSRASTDQHDDFSFLSSPSSLSLLPSAPTSLFRRSGRRICHGRRCATRAVEILPRRDRPQAAVGKDAPRAHYLVIPSTHHSVVTFIDRTYCTCTHMSYSL